MEICFENQLFKLFFPKNVLDSVFLPCVLVSYNVFAFALTKYLMRLSLTCNTLNLRKRTRYVLVESSESGR